MARRWAAPHSVKRSSSPGSSQPRAREPVHGRVPCVPRPATGRAQQPRRHVARRGVGHQCLDARQPVHHQQRDVSVAPVLTQDRLRVPQHQVRFVAARERPRGPPPAADPPPAGPPPRRPARARSAARRISSEANAASPSRRRLAASTAVKRAATSCSGVATSHAPGIAACTSSGLKLKNVETTTSAAHRTHRRRPGREVAGAARDAQPLVGIGRLGHEVHHAVQRLERPPRLACPRRAPSSVTGRPPPAGGRPAPRVAATTGRRLDASRTTSSRPSRSRCRCVHLAADEQPGQVVPAVERAPSHHGVGIEHALGHGAALQRRGTERPELRPPRGQPGEAGDPHDGAGRGRRSPTARSAGRPFRPRHRGRPRSARPSPGWSRHRPAALPRRARRCSWRRRARPGARWWSRRRDRSRPGDPTARLPSAPTPRTAPPGPPRATPAGRRRRPPGPGCTGPVFPPRAPSRRARRGPRARPRRPRRAPPAGERRPRGTNPTGRRSRPR